MMNIKEFFDSHANMVLTLHDSHLIGSYWTYHNKILTRHQRVLLSTESIASISYLEQELSILFILEGGARVEISYEDDDVILQFPGLSNTKHRYKNYSWDSI